MANGFEKDAMEGRYKIATFYKGNDWEIIIEPDMEEKLMVVVTAYCTGE